MTTPIDEHQDATEAMAAEFSAVLKTWLSPEKMQEEVCRNEGEHDPTICHSHDCCDANMAMHEVFMRHSKLPSGCEDLHPGWGRCHQTVR